MISGEIYMLTTRVASSTSNSGGVYQLVDPSERGNPDLCQNTVVVVSPAPTQPTGIITLFNNVLLVSFKPCSQIRLYSRVRRAVRTSLIYVLQIHLVTSL